ncbi:hypothetical protein [Paenibacillus thalictri]|nr:hypothetical protein [Paenibacillus thalictri]
MAKNNKQNKQKQQNDVEFAQEVGSNNQQSSRNKANQGSNK